MNNTSFRSRIRIISVCVFLFASILIIKLFTVSVLHRDTYTLRADKQYATPVGDIFQRGTIFFSNKDGSLLSAATVSSGFKIAMKPKEIVDIEDAYNKLSPYLNMTIEDFTKKASKKNDPYEELVGHLDKEKIDEIVKLNIKGIYTYKDNWRFYPGASMAAHSIGFVSYSDKGNDKVGQYGLERTYDKTLSKNNNDIYMNFFAEVFLNIKDTVTSKDKQGDIITTIEPQAQHILEEQLSETLNKWHGDQVGGIIINPKTGEIYALSSMPDFDLNNFSKVNNGSVYRNPLVEDVYEFGSVIKPLVVAGALDMGAITPETTYVDKGVVTVNKKDIMNFDKKARGLSTMQTVLDQSLNTGMVFIESKMGHDAFRNYMKSYGIGEKTGVDLPNETKGLIANIDSPRDIEYANASFGQGIALTPMEAVRAFSVLANGGNLITPHLVKRIKYEDGLSKEVEHKIQKTNIIKKETSTSISRMLSHVFESYGEGKYKMANYTIATKTGTAQVAMPNGKGYYTDRHMHSFFGYFPAYDPQFLVFIYINNPKEVRYASETLIPTFVNITKFLINYYDVAPDR